MPVNAVPERSTEFTVNDNVVDCVNVVAKAVLDGKLAPILLIADTR